MRRHPRRQFPEFGAGEQQGRPHEQRHAVPLPALLAGPLQLGPAHGREGLERHPFEVGHADDPAGPVADGGRLPYLHEGEQPLVARVLAGHALEQVHVLGRRQAVEEEMAQARELELLALHRMEAAEGLVLAKTRAVRPEREELDVRPRAAARHEHEHDAPQGPVESSLLELVPQHDGRSTPGWPGHSARGTPPPRTHDRRAWTPPGGGEPPARPARRRSGQRSRRHRSSARRAGRTRGRTATSLRWRAGCPPAGGTGSHAGS